MKESAPFYVPFYVNAEYEHSRPFPALEEMGETYEAAAQNAWERAERNSRNPASVFTSSFPLVEIRRCRLVPDELYRGRA